MFHFKQNALLSNKMCKVVIIGPESTGKSTLCAALAAHYGTDWCIEYARTYLMENGNQYVFADLLQIAKGQSRLENELLHRFAAQINVPLFFDTNQYVMKVWCEYVFNDCHNFILDQLAATSNDLYLLCKPDLPWIPDALREYPDEKPRQELYLMYKDLLVNQSVPWVEISGNNDQRINKAIAAVDDLVMRNEKK